MSDVDDLMVFGDFNGDGKVGSSCVLTRNNIQKLSSSFWNDVDPSKEYIKPENLVNEG